MSVDQAQPGPALERARIRDQRLRRSKLLAVLVVLLCVLVATIGVRISEPAEDFRVIKGEVDQTVEINGAELTVSDLRVGQLVTEEQTIQSRTSGMFVQIRVTLANRTALDKRTLNKSQLLSGDRIYEPYSSLINIGTNPGYETAGDYLFEVDPQQIDDLTLQIWNQGFLSGYHDRARIHLGITSGNADAWRTAAEDGLITTEDLQQTRVLR